MPLIESLENRGLQWAFKKYALNALRHWKTTVGGVAIIASAIGAASNYMQTCIADPSQLDLAHIGSISTMFAAGFAAISASDHGTPDVAFDSNGIAIPRAQVVE